MNTYFIASVAVYFLCASSPVLAKPIRKTIDKFGYDWAAGGEKYEFVFELPGEWSDADPGAYSRLSIRARDQKELVLDSLHGIELSAIVKKNDVALLSKYVSFVRLLGNKAPPVVVLQNWAFASSPGEIIILGLEGRVPKVLFRKDFEILRFADLRGNKDLEMIGWAFYGQCEGVDFCTYNPQLVLSEDQSGSSSKIKVDPDLSEKINIDRNYPWSGAEPSQGKMVYRETRFMTREEYRDLLQSEKKPQK